MSKFSKLLSVAIAAVMSMGILSFTVAAQGDTLNLIYWQAVSTLNPYLSSGTKDQEAASIILEPLANFDPEGNLVPKLAAEIPTLENGGVSEDLTSITWTLRDDIVWSDGSGFTSADVVFTYEYCTDPETGCVGLQFYEGIESVVADGDYSVTVTFTGPTPFPYNPFVSMSAPIIQAAQFADCIGAAAATCTDQNFGPIGTAGYMADEFRANDVVTYVPNPNYRDGAPGFAQIVLKGGGDAESAARAVLETGEADYAWNLQITPQVLGQMEAAGQGTVVVAFASSLERLMLNQTNPSPELGDARSVYGEGDNPHPFLTIPAVQQALSMAIDRTVIAEQLYGAGGQPACNIVNGPPYNVSPNNDGCLVQDIAGANALLDEAGIVDSDGDGIREADGVPLVILYQTSTNQVRQSTQALIKQWWSEIGVETELRNIDAAVFFGGDPASPDTFQKFFADIEMFTSGTSGPDPQSFLVRWICTPDSMPGPDNNWSGRNVPRHCDAAYDELYNELTVTGGQDARAELVISMNDILIENGAIIPLVFRGSVSAHSNTVEGVQINGWDSELWNIAEWTRSS